MPNALPNPTGSVFTLSKDLLKQGYESSRSSPRKRIIFPVQRDQGAQVQRLINFLQPNTYIRPHCHPLSHATESLYLISGELEVLIFSVDGDVIERHRLTADTPLIDLEPKVWHSMIVKTEDTAVFEIKRGPYDAETDKCFASWAPEEGSSEANSYLASLNTCGLS